jgi:flagellar biosynthesis protein FlhF
MKMKHYRAPDMRQALRMVRDEQGPDAVILSSRRVQGGVEVVAAIDYDADGGVDTYGRDGMAREAAEFHQTAPQAERAALTESFADGQRSSDDAAGYAALAQRLAGARAEAHELHAGLSAEVNEELRTLRRMLETQLATLAWNDLSRRAPVQTEVLKELTELGLAHDLAAELVTQLPSRLELAEAHRLALAMIARQISTIDERWLDAGGHVAFVGPTGVGKTTLIAKLAARWVLRHGTRDIALISTDSVRIGAQEQVHTLGRLLGVPAYALDGPSELPQLLEHLENKRLVLIDTAGCGQRDQRLVDELSLLASASQRLETCLVLSAASQAGALEEAVERFAVARPSACTLTKLDEATSLGGSISMLIRSKLPLAYVSEGQRVPEDLNPARAHQVVARAVELTRRAGARADEDLLQRRFGGVAHALA